MDEEMDEQMREAFCGWILKRGSAIVKNPFWLSYEAGFQAGAEYMRRKCKEEDPENWSMRK